MQRIGLGFDAHGFVAGRKLLLGGVEIEHPHGLAGHSDGDVLTHALCDALLGAANLGDIGSHFPASDPQYKDIASLKLLDQVVRLLDKRGWRLVNTDITVVCEKPQIAPHAEEIRRRIAAVCKVDTDVVSVKATTTEGMGFTGRGEGIAVMAVALVSK
jgi:2-C-methyl-D-erythritol 2,4-cyclodiphosphate synthase